MKEVSPYTYVQCKLNEGKVEEARNFCQGAMIVQSIFAALFLGLGIYMVLQNDVATRYIFAPAVFLAVITLAWAVNRARTWKQHIVRAG